MATRPWRRRRRMSPRRWRKLAARIDREADSRGIPRWMLLLKYAAKDSARMWRWDGRHGGIWGSPGPRSPARAARRVALQPPGEPRHGRRHRALQAKVREGAWGAQGATFEIRKVIVPIEEAHRELGVALPYGITPIEAELIAKERTDAGD